MQYQSPRPLSVAEAEDAFRSGQEERITESLISAALYITDRHWVEHWLIYFASHPAPDVRRAAALSLGHLARLHREVNPQAVAAVRNLLEDRLLSGAAADALEDVEIFTGRT